MVFHVTIYLYCDGNYDGCTCQVFGQDGDPKGFIEASSGDSAFETKKAYRTDMKKEGWVFLGQKAYCPNCNKIRLA